MAVFVYLFFVFFMEPLGISLCLYNDNIGFLLYNISISMSIYMCVGNFVKVYEEQLALAQYFTGPEEGWISLHFHLKALASAQKVKTDGGRKEAEANANLARLYLEQGDILAKHVCPLCQSGQALPRAR